LPQFVKVSSLDVKVEAFFVFVVVWLADYDVEDTFEPVADNMGGWAKPDVDPWGMNQVRYFWMAAHGLDINVNAVD
jgi:hypothetical protein